MRIREYPCLMRAAINIYLATRPTIAWNGLLCRKDEKKFLQLSHGRLLRILAFYRQIIRLFRNFNDVNNCFLVARLSSCLRSRDHRQLTKYDPANRVLCK